MESVAQAYLTERTAAAARVLTDAVATLHRGGDHRAAESLQDVLNVLNGQPRTFEEPVPGLAALVRLAGRERRDPYGMLPGEHVRLAWQDGSNIVGLWCYDEPSEEWPVGRAYIIRDDNGEEYDVGGGGMQIQPLWLDLRLRDKADAVARAVTVIASAWAERRALRPVEHDDLIKHEHLDYDQPVDATFAQREKRRRCDCGELAELRVTVWSPSPNTEVPADHTIADPTSWMQPAEFGEETVCSIGCAEDWVTRFKVSATETLGPLAVTHRRVNVQPWEYEPAFDDLPGALAQAQELTAAAATDVRNAARAWLSEKFDTAAGWISNARSAATVALARIAELEPVERGPLRYTAGDAEPETFVTVHTASGDEYVNDPIHRMWLPNWRDRGVESTTWDALLAAGDVWAPRAPELLPSVTATHPRDVPVDVWLQMAAPLVAKILDDPHRYQVIDGGAVVYDRQTNQLISGRTGLHARIVQARTVDGTPIPSDLGTMITIAGTDKFCVYDGSGWREFDTVDEAHEYRKTLFPGNPE